MFLDFSKSLTKLMLEQEFTLFAILGGEPDELTPQTSMVLYLKAVPPQLYLVAAVNLDLVSLGDYPAAFSFYLNRLAENLPRYYCRRLVTIHLLFTEEESAEVRAFADSQNPIPDAECSEIYWVVGGKNKTVIPGRQQPKDLLRLRKPIERAMSATRIQGDLREIQEDVRQNSPFWARDRSHKLTHFLILVNIVVFFVSIQPGFEGRAILAFGNSPQGVLQYHQYYRLFTSMFLHIDVSHLVMNCVALYFFGGEVEKAFSRKAYTAIYLISGLVGSIFSIFLTRTLSAGASGAIYGLLGALLAFTHVNKRRVGGLDNMTLLVLAIVMFLSGFFVGNVDYFAHLGGLLGGYTVALIQQIYLRRRRV